jgi:hypothetical protein
MSITYTFVAGSRYDQKRAQEVGEYLEGLEERTPEALVADAKRPSSPLHGFFTWDNAEAAQAHRLEQARHLLRSVTVRFTDWGASPPQRGFVALRVRPVAGEEEPAATQYLPIRSILDDPQLRAQLLDEALAQAQMWRARYAKLRELSEVFAALDAVRRKQKK